MIIIISKKIISKEGTLTINQEVELISDYSLLFNNQIIDFDYLISDDYKLLKNLDKANILLDEGIPVTNFYQQTSKEHIYIGDIDIALDYLYNGDE